MTDHLPARRDPSEVQPYKQKTGAVSSAETPRGNVEPHNERGGPLQHPPRTGGPVLPQEEPAIPNPPPALKRNKLWKALAAAALLVAGAVGGYKLLHKSGSAAPEPATSGGKLALSPGDLLNEDLLQSQTLSSMDERRAQQLSDAFNAQMAKNSTKPARFASEGPSATFTVVTPPVGKEGASNQGVGLFCAENQHGQTELFQFRHEDGGVFGSDKNKFVEMPAFRNPAEQTVTQEEDCKKRLARHERHLWSETAEKNIVSRKDGSVHSAEKKPGM